MGFAPQVTDQNLKNGTDWAAYLGNSTPAGETGDAEAETDDLPAVDGGPAAVIGVGSDE